MSAANESIQSTLTLIGLNVRLGISAQSSPDPAACNDHQVDRAAGLGVTLLRNVKQQHRVCVPHGVQYKNCCITFGTCPAQFSALALLRAGTTRPCPSSQSHNCSCRPANRCSPPAWYRVPTLPPDVEDGVVLVLSPVVGLWHMRRGERPRCR